MCEFKIKDSIKIHKETFNDKMVISFYGYIDLYNSIDVQTILKRLYDKIINYYIFDFSNLNYISSVGIGIVIEFYKMIKGKKLFILHCSKRVYQSFDVLGFNSFENIKFFDSVDSMKKFIKE